MISSARRDTTVSGPVLQCPSTSQFLSSISTGSPLDRGCAVYLADARKASTTLEGEVPREYAACRFCECFGHWMYRHCRAAAVRAHVGTVDEPLTRVGALHALGRSIVMHMAQTRARRPKYEVQVRSHRSFTCLHYRYLSVDPSYPPPDNCIRAPGAEAQGRSCVVGTSFHRVHHITHANCLCSTEPGGCGTAADAGASVPRVCTWSAFPHAWLVGIKSQRYRCAHLMAYAIPGPGCCGPHGLLQTARLGVREHPVQCLMGSL